MSARFLLYLGLLFIITLAGVVRFKRLTTPFQVLVIITGITFASELSSRFFAIRIRNSSPPYHIYAPLQLILYARVYFLLIKNATIKGLILYVTPALVTFSIANSLFFQPFYTFPSHIIIATSFALILLSLFYFKEMLQFPVEVALVRQSTFWLNCAVLVFFCTTFFIYSFYNYFIRHQISTRLISNINFLMTIAYYSVLAFAIMADKKKQWD